jgi:hypothetical protein
MVKGELLEEVVGVEEEIKLGAVVGEGRRRGRTVFIQI